MGFGWEMTEKPLACLWLLGWSPRVTHALLGVAGEKMALTIFLWLGATPLAVERLSVRMVGAYFAYDKEILRGRSCHR